MKQGWEMKKFEELIQENQIGLIKSTKEQGNDKAFRYLKMDSITSDNTLVHNKYVYVDATSDELEKFTLNDGDFLFNTRNSYELVGKTCVFSPIDDEPTLFNNNIMRVVFKKGVSSKFINYAFSSEQVKERLQKLKSGTTSVVGIYYNGLRNLEIPLPPLPEQQRIVSILDEAFSAIAKAKANAEQNLKNAKELFESYLQGVFEKKGDGWEIRTLGEVSKINYGYTEKASFDEVGPKFLRITDIQENGVDWDTVPYCKCSDKDLPKYKLETGDIVFARTGATTGKSYLINNPPNSVFASYLIRLRMNSINEFIPEFISYFFQTKTYWDKINAGISGSAQGGFNATKLGELEFHFPKSKKAQQTIVRQLDALRAETQKLEAVYQKKIDDLEELKKSILKKAFAGELTKKEVEV